jgi:hypothetical protein
MIGAVRETQICYYYYYGTLSLYKKMENIKNGKKVYMYVILFVN